MYYKNHVFTNLEKDFLLAIPEKFKDGAFLAYKEWRTKTVFNGVTERSKATLAYMDAFVTAIAMVQEIENGEHSNSNAPDEREGLPQAPEESAAGV